MIKINYFTIAITGALIWLWLVINMQANPHHHEWSRQVVLLAALVLVPLAFRALRYPEKSALPVALGGYMLFAAMYMPVGTYSGILACGWLLICAWAFKNGVDGLLKNERTPAQWAISAGQIFLIVGGLSSVADRFGLQPLGFDAVIVLLTAVHFHFAGFIFPLLTGWVYQQKPDQISRFAALMAVISVPLTFLGITFSKISGNYIPEAVAAAAVAAAGWACGWGLLQISGNARSPWPVRILCIIAGLSLFFSMTLALAYAIRPVYAIDWINIPNMRAWHGTVNALGVGVSGVLAMSYKL